MNTFEEQIEQLVNAASSAEKSEDAMRFSQAAVNVANVAQSLAHLKMHLTEN